METPGRHKLKIVTKIGKGAFGTVYKGTYDGTACAVKTIADDHCSAPDNIATRMFLREAQVLQACSHRNIIGFKALCRVNADKPSHELSKNAPAGKWAMVVEYAKDGTLCQKVSKQMITPSVKVYTNAQALGWALDVASALEYLHLRSPAIFHRDVKLSNVVLTRSDAGALIAKLSDFGLHVVADNTRDRLVRVSQAATGTQWSTTSGARPPGLRALAACAESPGLTAEAVAELQQRLHGSEPASDSSAGKGSFDRDSAWQTHALRGKAGKPAADDHDYSEMHDGLGGRKSFIGGQQAPALLLPVSASRSPDVSGASSFTVGGGAERRTSFAFRRASHHPGGNELVMARVPSLQPPASGNDAAAGAQDRSVHWSEYDFDNCSIATDGTYVSGTTPGASDCSSDCDGSTIADMETVFNMTGQTGSSMYMAPEVCLGEPYNEKADVFSLGVVLYELMARCLLIFTELPTCTTDPNAPDRYARKVSQGYRPARPKRMSDGAWQLIEACWQQDPVLRPHMSEVVSVLQALLQAEQSSSSAAPSALTRPMGSQDTSAAGGPPMSDGFAGEPDKGGGCCVIA